MVWKPRVIFKGMKSGSKMSRFPTDFPARHPHQFYLGRGVGVSKFSKKSHLNFCAKINEFL